MFVERFAQVCRVRMYIVLWGKYHERGGYLARRIFLYEIIEPAAVREGEGRIPRMRWALGHFPHLSHVRARAEGL